MSKESSSTNSGIGILGVLGIIFVTLKLLGIGEVAAWSWWWVTAPFWAGIALFLVVFAILAVISGITVLLNR